MHFKNDGNYEVYLYLYVISNSGLHISSGRKNTEEWRIGKRLWTKLKQHKMQSSLLDYVRKIGSSCDY